jgi:hypothetical protein
VRRQSTHEFAELIWRQNYSLFGAPGDVLDLDDLDEVPAFER